MKRSTLAGIFGWDASCVKKYWFVSQGMLSSLMFLGDLSKQRYSSFDSWWILVSNAARLLIATQRLDFKNYGKRMNVLSFPSSVTKSKDGEGTITICWTLFLKHFRGGEAFLSILHDAVVSCAPLNSNDVLLLLAVCKAHSSCPWLECEQRFAAHIPTAAASNLVQLRCSPSSWDCHWCLRGSRQGPSGEAHSWLQLLPCLLCGGRNAHEKGEKL